MPLFILISCASSQHKKTQEKIDKKKVEFFKILDEDPDVLKAREKLKEPVPPKETEQPPDGEVYIESEKDIKQKTFSMSFKEPVDMYLVINNLARESSKNIIFGEEVSGKVFVNIKGLTFYQVLDVILKQNGYYYEEKDGIITIKRNITKTFYINFPNTVIESGSQLGSIRSASTSSSSSNTSANQSASVQSTTSTDSSSSSSSSASGNTSNFLNKSEAKRDIWKEIEGTLNGILSMGVNADVKSISYIPPVIDPAVGTIIVSANPEKMKLVEDYIEFVNKRLKRQIRCDVYIYAVLTDLNETFGIDWGLLAKSETVQVALGQRLGQFTQSGEDLSFNNQFANNLNYKQAAMGLLKSNLRILLNALSEQAEMYSFYKRSVVVTHNYPSYFEYGEEDRYYIFDTYSTFSTAATQNQIRQIEKPFFTGIKMNILASIGDDETIILEIPIEMYSIARKKLTLTTLKDDSGKALTQEEPVLTSNRFKGIMTLKDGEIGHFSALADEILNSSDSGIPYLEKYPFIKNIFKSGISNDKKLNFLFLIKPTIL
jgi:type II secretory pathway component GspD/PulD (secretin)